MRLLDTEPDAHADNTKSNDTIADDPVADDAQADTSTDLPGLFRV